MNQATERVFPKAEGLTQATLTLRSGVSALALRSRALPNALAKASFSSPDAEIAQQGGELSVKFPWWAWMRPSCGRGRIELSDDVPFQVDVRGGVSDLDADLRTLRLRGLDIRGGVSGMVLALPTPERDTPITVHGGAVKLFVMRPRDVPIRLDIRGGATELSTDFLSVRAIGGPFTYRAPDDDGTRPGYTLTIHGGVCSLVIERSAEALAA